MNNLVKPGGFLMFRKKMNQRYSKKMFSRTASDIHPRNFRGRSAMPMRGGYRI